MRGIGMRGRDGVEKAGIGAGEGGGDLMYRCI